jgi:hypothetical protein
VADLAGDAAGDGVVAVFGVDAQPATSTTTATVV